MKLFKILPSEDEEEQLEERRRADEAAAAVQPLPRPAPLYWTLAVLLVALGPRLFYLFAASNPENAGVGWYGDVYHHWQIAYLTQQIGLTASDGPRLWDLKGLDYFWGILHPSLLVLLFFVTGSIDIILARLLSLSFGVLVVVLIFLLCQRYWGLTVALVAAAFAALAPTSVFNDASGMLEPLGVGLCLLGIYLWPKRGVWTGIAWALASMARAEAWIFSLGLVVASFLRRQAVIHRLPMVIAWAVGILLYMKILLDRTGIPIYPIYWNFLANAFGKWEFRDKLTPTQLAVRPLLGIILVLATVGLGLTLWKRPRSYMFLTFGFGYWIFTAGFLGFTAYLKSWESWFWMIRFFVFPYEFAAVLVAIGLFVLAPRYLGRLAIPAAWTASVLALLAVQLEWSPIRYMYDRTGPRWGNALAAGGYLGEIYNRPEYRGGVLNLPPSNPDITYTLARFGHVEGKHIVGQLYDPFYYLPSGYRYADHPQVASTLLQCWLVRTNSRLFVIEPNSENYRLFVSSHPGWFRPVGEVPAFEWAVEEVQVPEPTALECDQAAQSART